MMEACSRIPLRRRTGAKIKVQPVLQMGTWRTRAALAALYLMVACYPFSSRVDVALLSRMRTNAGSRIGS